MNVSWVGVYLSFLFQLQKRGINHKGGGICVRRDVTQEGLVIIRDEAWLWVWVGQKKVILPWSNYWTVPKQRQNFKIPEHPEENGQEIEKNTLFVIAPFNHLSIFSFLYLFFFSLYISKFVRTSILLYFKVICLIYSVITDQETLSKKVCDPIFRLIVYFY